MKRPLHVQMVPFCAASKSPASRVPHAAATARSARGPRSCPMPHESGRTPRSDGSQRRIAGNPPVRPDPSGRTLPRVPRARGVSAPCRAGNRRGRFPQAARLRLELRRGEQFRRRAALPETRRTGHVEVELVPGETAAGGIGTGVERLGGAGRKRGSVPTASPPIPPTQSMRARRSVRSRRRGFCGNGARTAEGTPPPPAGPPRPGPCVRGAETTSPRRSPFPAPPAACGIPAAGSMGSGFVSQRTSPRVRSRRRRREEGTGRSRSPRFPVSRTTRSRTRAFSAPRGTRSSTEAGALSQATQTGGQMRPHADDSARPSASGASRTVSSGSPMERSTARSVSGGGVLRWRRMSK